MIDMVIFMRRFGNDLLNELDCWMGYGTASTMMYQIMTAVTEWCGYVFGIVAACVYIRLMLEAMITISDRFLLLPLGPFETTNLRLQLLGHV